MKEHIYYVYILTNKRNNCFYIGVTNNLLDRYYKHKNKIDPKSFTAKYNVDKLVFYEIFGDINAAIFREKELKGWRREKKINLIKSKNIRFEDLEKDLY
jgi:putative endonuclease